MSHVIIVAGLGDATAYIKWATKQWPRQYGLTPVVFIVGWGDKPSEYENKYQRLASLLDELGPAAVIGISAGGSFALNALRRYPDRVSCAISICGPVRLRAKDQTLRRLNESPLLRQSINEQQKGTLAERAMTLRPIYDRIVYPGNVPVEGARNSRMPVIGHVLGIGWALYCRDKQMAEFIRRCNAGNRS
jgi:pimeloyl-ACP methyl ester carboxylesterase